MDISLSAAIVQSLLRARQRGLPPAVLESTRLHIADALGIGAAARSTALAGQVMAAQGLLSGAGSCRLIGGGKAAPAAAAYINAALIHILDYDDIHDVGRLHPGAVVLPAALAAAETAGASDEALVEAVALATELICRLGVVCAPQGEGPGSEWFLTQLFGYVAASVAAGLALGLSQDALVSAIGLAYMQAAGGKQAGFGTGATARAVYPAFAAQGGLQAAFLARAGLTGPEGALDGAAGLFRIYLGGQLQPEQRAALLDFSAWHCGAVDIKPWPSCRLSHPYVAVALAARAAQQSGAILRARVAVNASAARLCRPLPQRRRPLTLQDAKYSIPFMTAFALVRGAPSLDGLGEGAMRDPQVLDMADRIGVEETLPDNPGHPPAVLTLEHEGGRASTWRYAPGDLRMDRDSTRAKFFECYRYAGLESAAGAAWQAAIDGHIGKAMQL
ncbi:MmgE/PrpD family protein [Pollutimonas bauzanensis]|uniref:2-methylcitrate dehydratase PrpD n=1 Tax=Pollutimonas bauzanensis TaxID=658167 RepID=A0A1M5QW63_9BURK|nr:MmgE/PrpD family protein [Pollutimonas bauzanensis]SHH18365.1 2-methylcitrate dehydratase PrpD [Pollutimonas bauzanensis]